MRLSAESMKTVLDSQAIHNAIKVIEIYLNTIIEMQRCWTRNINHNNILTHSVKRVLGLIAIIVLTNLFRFLE